MANRLVMMPPRLISAILWTLVSVNFFTLVIGGLVTWLGYAIPVRLKQFGLLPEIAIVAGFASLIVACLGLCALNYSSHHALNVYGVSCMMFASLMVFGLPDTLSGTSTASSTFPFGPSNSTTATSNQMTIQNKTTTTTDTSTSNLHIQQHQQPQQRHNYHHSHQHYATENGVARGSLGLDIVYFSLLFILHLVSVSSFTFARYLKRKELEDLDLDAEQEHDCEEQKYGLSSLDVHGIGCCEADSPPIICTCQQHMHQLQQQFTNYQQSNRSLQQQQQEQQQLNGSKLNNKLNANDLMHQSDSVRVGDETISLSLYQRRQPQATLNNHQLNQQQQQFFNQRPGQAQPTYYITLKGMGSRSSGGVTNQSFRYAKSRATGSSNPLSSCKSAPPNYTNTNKYQSVGGTSNSLPQSQMQTSPAPLAHKGFYRIDNKRLMSSDGDLTRHQQQQHRWTNSSRVDDDNDNGGDEEEREGVKKDERREENAPTGSERGEDADYEDEELARTNRQRSRHQHLRRRCSSPRGQLEDEYFGDGGSCSDQDCRAANTATTATVAAGRQWISGSSSMRNLTSQTDPATTTMTSNVLRQNLALLNHLNQQQQQQYYNEQVAADRERANTLIVQSSSCRCNEATKNQLQHRPYQHQLNGAAATSAATSLAARLDTTGIATSNPSDWLDLPVTATASTASGFTAAKNSKSNYNHNHHQHHRVHNLGRKCRAMAANPTTDYPILHPTLSDAYATTMPRLGFGLTPIGGGLTTSYAINRYNKAALSNVKPSKKPKSSSVLGVTAGIAAALFGGVADGIAEPSVGWDHDGGLFSGGLSGAGQLDVNESALMDDNQLGLDNHDHEFNASMADMVPSTFGHQMQSLSRRPVLDFTPLLELRKH